MSVEDELAAALAGIARLEERQRHLEERQRAHLALIHNLAHTVPLDSEVATALEQRGVLLAEIGTLRADLFAARDALIREGVERDDARHSLAWLIAEVRAEAKRLQYPGDRPGYAARLSSLCDRATQQNPSAEEKLEQKRAQIEARRATPDELLAQVERLIAEVRAEADYLESVGGDTAGKQLRAIADRGGKSAP